jgi:hypothetical protein
LAKKEDIVAFLPFANIWNSSSANASLITTFQEIGHKIRIVGCHSVFSFYCASMEEAGLTVSASLAEKERICELCRARSALVSGHTKSEHINLDEYVDEDSEELIEYHLSKVDAKSWIDLLIDDVPVGSISGYEFYIRHKLTSLVIPQELFSEFTQVLRQTLRVFFAWKEFLKSSTEQLVIIENEMYSANRVVAILSRRAGRQVYGISHGVDIRKFGNSLTLIENPEIWFGLSRSDSWKESRARFPSSDEIKQVSEHILELSRGRSPWVYSAKARSTPQELVRTKLEIPKGKPVVMALTSSLDEQIATNLTQIHSESLHEAEGSLFRDQLDWLRFLSSEAAKQSDYHLVIRIHPRLLPNKRDSVTSSFSREISEALIENPKNLTVNWPQDNISIWSALAETNLVANYSSTAGLEALLMGLPVIQHDPRVMHAYPAEFNLTPSTRDDYSNILATGVGNEGALEGIFSVYRWLSWKFNVFARNVDNGIPDRQSWTLMRVLNGLVLRKNAGVLEGPLRSMEKLELKSQYVDGTLARALSELIDFRKTDLSNVSSAFGWDPQESKLLIASAHANTLTRIFGRRDVRRLSIVDHLEKYIS